MNELDYNNKLKAIEENFDAERKALYLDFARSNAKFKIGDRITNGQVSFVIDKITFQKAWSLPECLYHGFELKKDFTPRKDGARSCIWNSNKDAKII
jgi:hypothetical protein